MIKTKTIIYLIIGIMIGSNIGIYATNKLVSNLVIYDNEVTSANNTKEALDELFEKTYKNLVDVANVGDYVAYDVGVWTETKAKPTSQGEFGGYIAGQNKASSVTCEGATNLKGWRVLKIEDKKIYLVHAGQPECHYEASGYSNQSVMALNNRATSEYLNSIYADSAHALTYDEALMVTGSTNSTDNTLRNINTHYWLATAYNTYSLWHVDLGTILVGSNNTSFGFRPVVVLKENIKTSGKTTDAVGQEAWNLITP